MLVRIQPRPCPKKPAPLSAVVYNALTPPLPGGFKVWNLKQLALSDDDLTHLSAPQVGANPPTEAASRSLLYTYVDGHEKPTAWASDARKLHKKHPDAKLYDHPFIFEGAAFPVDEQWNSTLFTMVARACRIFERLRGTTAKHIYALFIAPVSTLIPNSPGYDWPTTLWSMVSRVWVEIETQKAAVEQDACALTLSVLDGIREWCPILPSDEAQATAWAHQHLIACLGSSHYPIQPDGRYSALEVQSDKLPAQIRAIGLSPLVKLEELDDKGRPRAIPTTTIITRHGTNLRRVEMRVGDRGGWIEHPGTDEATLVLRGYARASLPAVRQPDIEEWLQLFGGVHYQKLCRWIAMSLRFDSGKGVAALSLVGAPGSGKGMFVRGLGECVNTGEVLSAAELFSDFKEGLLETPFVSVDECWPEGRSATGTFRKLVGDCVHRVNRKFLPVISFRASLRVVLSSNGNNLLNDLVRGADLSPDDRKAIADRLFHVNIPKACSGYLAAKGGRAYTDTWIAPGGTRLAQHFLWLHEQYAADAGDKRWLFDGGFQPEVIGAMRFSSGKGPLVVAAVLSMIAKRSPDIAVFEGRLYVLASAVLAYHKASEGESLSMQAVVAGLVNMLPAGAVVPVPVRVLPSRPIGRQAWYEIDAPALLQQARVDGSPCPPLEELVEGKAMPPPPVRKVIPFPQKRAQEG